MSTSEFDQLKADLADGGVDAVLDRLVDRLRVQKRYHELFEALKMRLRRRMDLPLIQDRRQEDNLDQAQCRQLEEGLIEACREVGTLLFREGKIHEGWLYLRPVGDPAAAAEELAKIEVNEDNLQEYVEVALNEGVDMQRGFAAVLDLYGTCNAITTYETVLSGRGLEDQQTAVEMLVRRLHSDLVESLQADIAQHEGTSPPETTLRELVADRDWLFGENGYHIDTTHLTSIVQFARVLNNPDALRLALDLTHYGRRLSSRLQFPNEEPFADFYPSHAYYFQALLGEQVDQALDYFRQLATTVDVEQHGSGAIEVYLVLLAQLQRYDEAIDTSIKLLPPGVETYHHAPSLLELSERAGSYQRLIAVCQQRDDLLGFATGLMQDALRVN